MTNGNNIRVPFTPDSTAKRGKRGNKSYICLCKMFKAKTGVTSHLSVPRVRNNQCRGLLFPINCVQRQSLLSLPLDLVTR